MEKPKFSLMTAFWLMLTACAFLAGRASNTKQLQEFEGRAVNAEVTVERLRRNEQTVEETVSMSNEFPDLLEVLDGLGTLRFQTGRAVEVIDSQSFRFEEYDDQGKTISTHVVELDAIICPKQDERFFVETKRLLTENLLGTDNPDVIVITPLAGAKNEPLRSFVASQAQINRFETQVLQFQLVSAGLARLDRQHPFAGVFDNLSRQESDARRLRQGLWSLE